MEKNISPDSGLPENGVNGWTGEPKERYYELPGVNRGRSERSP